MPHTPQKASSVGDARANLTNISIVNGLAPNNSEEWFGVVIVSPEPSKSAELVPKGGVTVVLSFAFPANVIVFGVGLSSNEDVALFAPSSPSKRDTFAR